MGQKIEILEKRRVIMTEIAEMLLEMGQLIPANRPDWTRNMCQQVADAREEVDFLTQEIEELKRR